MTYTFNLGITIFGIPPGYSPSYPVNDIISEFKSFVESNSKLRFKITQSVQSVLTAAEITDPTWGNWPMPQNLTIEHKQKIPQTVQCNIILYDYIGLSPIYGGGTIGDGLYGKPYIAIPLGAWPISELSPWGSWTYARSQTLVHEWLHAVDILLAKSGFVDFPSSDDCDTQFGYDETNDPGWSKCYTKYLSMLTPEMYQKIATASSSSLGIKTIAALGIGTMILSEMMKTRKYHK